MFHDIPEKMLRRMEQLEARDEQDRADGTTRMQRLRQITRETGELLAILAASSPAGTAIEIGTSAGYSALWLAMGLAGRHLYTFELLPEKIALAKETFAQAGVEERITLVEGDALANLPEYSDIGFAFIDTEKELYRPCYDILLPRMAGGALLAADNVESHREALADFLAYVQQDARVDAVVLPVGKGVLLCRKV